MNPEEFSSAWFDSSSKAWLLNKRRKGQSYVYRCQHQHKNGNLCKRDVHWHHGNMELLCKWHFFDYQRQERLLRHKAKENNLVEE